MPRRRGVDSPDKTKNCRQLALNISNILGSTGNWSPWMLGRPPSTVTAAKYGTSFDSSSRGPLASVGNQPIYSNSWQIVPWRQGRKAMASPEAKYQLAVALVLTILVKQYRDGYSLSWKLFYTVIHNLFLHDHLHLKLIRGELPATTYSSRIHQSPLSLPIFIFIFTPGIRKEIKATKRVTYRGYSHKAKHRRFTHFATSKYGKHTCHIR